MRYLAKRPNRVNGGLLDFPQSVEEMFDRFWTLNPALAAARADALTPAVDIVETPQAYVICTELPGIDPADVDITLTGDTLTIRGEKKLPELADDHTWCLNERAAGTFERRFQLATPVTDKGIEAEARHGVLTVKVMKAEEAQPRKISIKTS